MTILFYEGMPRSGKSYTAVSRMMADALRAGRPVDAYVDGLDHEKIAPLVGLTVERCKELLVYVPEDQVLRLPYITRDNALVVIDELQNFFPAQRKPLESDWAKYIAEHGHRGQDILTMGQAFADCHPFWRRRTKTKMVFTKMDAVGAENRFNVATYTAPTAEKFVLVSEAIDTYEPTWFGTYKSHVGSTIQTGNVKDKRATIIGGSFVKIVVPLTIVAALAGGWTLYRFFTGEAFKKKDTEATAPAKDGTRPSERRAERAVPMTAATAKQGGFLDTLNDSYRVRLAAWIGRPYGNDVITEGVVEWWDGSTLRERLTFEQIKSLGGTVFAAGGIARVNGREATHWPITDVQRDFRSVTPMGEPKQ